MSKLYYACQGGKLMICQNIGNVGIRCQPTGKPCPTTSGQSAGCNNCYEGGNRNVRVPQINYTPTAPHKQDSPQGLVASLLKSLGF